MQWIFEHAGDLFGIISAVVSVASLVANMTPTESDNKIVEKVGKAVHFLALNWKKPV
jgi:hypothetical protein